MRGNEEMAGWRGAEGGKGRGSRVLVSLFLPHSHTNSHGSTVTHFPRIRFPVYPVWPTSGTYRPNNTASHSPPLPPHIHTDKILCGRTVAFIWGVFTPKSIYFICTYTHNLFHFPPEKQMDKSLKRRFLCLHTVHPLLPPPLFASLSSNTLSRGYVCVCVCVFLSLWYKHKDWLGEPWPYWANITHTYTHTVLCKLFLPSVLIIPLLWHLAKLYETVSVHVCEEVNGCRRYSVDCARVKNKRGRWLMLVLATLIWLTLIPVWKIDGCYQVCMEVKAHMWNDLCKLIQTTLSGRLRPDIKLPLTSHSSGRCSESYIKSITNWPWQRNNMTVGHEMQLHVVGWYADILIMSDTSPIWSIITNRTGCKSFDMPEKVLRFTRLPQSKKCKMWGSSTVIAVMYYYV